MTFTYDYSISNDIPGGILTPDAETRLQGLILAAGFKSATLENIGTSGDTLSVNFSNELSADDKKALDGDQTDPAGGIVARCADYLAVVQSGLALANNASLALASDKQSTANLVLQIKAGDGKDTTGNFEQVIVNPGGICPISAMSGNFDKAGQFAFSFGPTELKGFVTVEFAVTNFATVSVAIRLG